MDVSLNIQQIDNITKVDIQIFIDINLDNGIKWILDAYEIALKVIYGHRLSAGIHDPIFTDAVIFVVVCFEDMLNRKRNEASIENAPAGNRDISDAD